MMVVLVTPHLAANSLIRPSHCTSRTYVASVWVVSVIFLAYLSYLRLVTVSLGLNSQTCTLCVECQWMIFIMHKNIQYHNMRRTLWCDAITDTEPELSRLASTTTQ